MQDQEDAYKLLGLQSSAKPKAIRAAYRRLSRKLSSDNPDDARTLEALTRAYDVLIDPRKRADYNAKRAKTRDSGARSMDEEAPPGQPREAGEPEAASAPAVSILSAGPGAGLLTAVIVLTFLAVAGAILASLIVT